MTTTDQEPTMDHPADSAFWGYTEDDAPEFEPVQPPDEPREPTCPTCGDTAEWCADFRAQA